MAKKLKIYNGASWEDVTFAITPPNTAVTNAFSTNQVVDVSTSVAALRITQRGTGEALRVEDDTNPDASPFVINSAGLVGIGTSSPDSALHIAAAGDTTINLTKTGQSTWFIQTLDAGVFRLYSGTANAERLRIDTSGNVGIGSSNPKVRFQASGSTNSTSMPSLGTASGSLYVTGLDNAYGLLAGTSSSTGAVWMQAQRTDGTAAAYNILLNPSGGNVGIGNTNPTYKIDLANGFSSTTIGDTSLFVRLLASAGNQDMLQMYSERTLAGGASWATQDWILRRHVDATTMGGFRWAAGDQNVRSVYGTPTTPSVRTSHISTSAPSGGIDGDIWLVYTA
jgi:hypothetical protein